MCVDDCTSVVFMFIVGPEDGVGWVIAPTSVDCGIVCDVDGIDSESV